MTDRKQTSDNAHLTQKGENPLTHQERVYFEMFRAIELLGRKLEKSEMVREELSSRLKDIESSAARDAETGKYYLPAKIETAAISAAAEGMMSRRIITGAALAGLAFGVVALGLVLLQQQPQTLSPRQMAALNNLADAQNKTAFADHVSGGWHKVVENNKPAPVVAENVTAAMGVELAAASSAPRPFELAASLETLGAVQDVPQAMPDAADTPEDEYMVAADEDLPEEMAQGDTDMAEDAPIGTAAADVAAFGHDDLAALVAQENAVDEQFAEAADVMPADAALTTVVAAAQEVAPKATAYTQEPERDTLLPAVYVDLERRAYDGIAEAQHDLAALYAAGGRVRSDYSRAAYWFRRAADAGIANAYYNLGVMAQQGLGMAKDAEQSFAFYGRAARLGHPEAMYNLGLCYIEGRGTQRDNLRGISYFKKAANAGLTQAAYNLGVIYEGGTVEGHRDLKSALEWYHVAAVEGHQDADAAIRRVEGLRMQAEALSVADKVEPAAGR